MCTEYPTPFPFPAQPRSRSCRSVPPILSSHFFEFDDDSDKMTGDAIEPRLSLLRRRLSSEGSDLEDSLCHRFRLLRGKLGKTKVSQSLFCCSVEGAAYSADIIPGEHAHFRPDLGRGRLCHLCTCWVDPSLPFPLACFVHPDWLSPQRGQR